MLLTVLWGQIPIEVARNGDGTGLGRMLKLPMATSKMIEHPAVSLHFRDYH